MTLLCNSGGDTGSIYSDIAPIEGSSVPGYLNGSHPEIYRTAAEVRKSSGSGVNIVAFFESEPTLTGYNVENARIEQLSNGIWFMTMGYYGWESMADPELAEADIPLYKNDVDGWYAFIETKYYDHTWKSVKSIIGKEGSFRLSDIVNINNGEAVNDVVAAGNVNFTKKTKLDTLINRALETDGNPTKATVSFTLPNATYSFAKLVYKLGQMPEDEDDGVTIDITPDDSVAKIEDLEQDKSYWFAIFTNKTESNAVEYRTGEVSDEYYEFDYTGSIQTFIAPKTGYYQIETWGAQGADATDGTNTARGGYGAYSVGEVLLNQGDTLYINVGGQDGYGGGGNFIPPDLEYIKNVNNLKLYRSSTFFEVKEQTECWGDNNTHTTAFDASNKTSVAINNSDYTLFHTEAGVVQASDPTETYCFALASILSINLVKGSGTSYTAEYSTVEDGNFFTDSSFYNQSSLRFVIDKYTRFNYRPYTASRPTFRTSFTDLTDAIEYIYANFAYINLYVDGALWVEA